MPPPPGLPFDLVKRMAAAEARLAEREKKRTPGKKTKGTTHAE